MRQSSVILHECRSISCISFNNDLSAVFKVWIKVRVHAKFGEDPTKSLGGKEENLFRNNMPLMQNIGHIRIFPPVYI